MVGWYLIIWQHAPLTIICLRWLGCFTGDFHCTINQREFVYYQTISYQSSKLFCKWSSFQLDLWERSTIRNRNRSSDKPNAVLDLTHPRLHVGNKSSHCDQALSVTVTSTTCVKLSSSVSRDFSAFSKLPKTKTRHFHFRLQPIIATDSIFQRNG